MTESRPAMYSDPRCTPPPDPCPRPPLAPDQALAEYDSDGAPLWVSRWTTRDGTNRILRLTVPPDDRHTGVRFRIWAFDGPEPRESRTLRPLGGGIRLGGRDLPAIVRALAEHVEDMSATTEPGRWDDLFAPEATP